MANPFDVITQDDSDAPLEQRGMRGISIRPYNGGPDVASGGNNALTQAMAPEPAAQQPWTVEDLMKGLAALKEYVTTGEFSPGTRVGNRLFGTGGEERYQTWPEKMVRSGVGAAGNALSSLEPVTSEQLIAPAMDMAGMAGGSALIERPGAATLGSGPVRPAARAMPTEPAPVFYSALEHAATSAAQDVMMPQQWLGYLKNQPGVKAEELQWTAIGDWLGQQKGKVRKEDVQRYLDEHKVEIKDMTKSVSNHEELEGFIEENYDMLRAEAERDVRRADPELEQQDPSRFADAIEDAIHEIADDHISKAGEGVKYSEYQLPGGENYREHLLTLPVRGEGRPRATAQQLAELAGEDWATLGPNGRQRFQDQAERAGTTGEYKSSHWDEPNVLAHVRTNDRTIDGKKALHIEEIQSDWHQQGRKQGYAGDTKGWTAIKNENGGWDVKTPDGGIRYRLNKDEATTPEEAIEEASRQLASHRSPTVVPDAPFKTSWPELALKRMIRKAAEEGYDRISWTPGEAQAARYDLSKQVKLLSAQKIGDKYNVYIEGKDGQPLFRRGNGWSDHGQKTMTAEELEATVGKDPAKKIIEGKPNKEGWVDVKDEGLKVGGEGMREFYDKMLPKMVEKIGKAHGVKVKQTQLGKPPAEIGHIKAYKDAWGKEFPEKWTVDNGQEMKAFGSRKEAEDFAKAETGSQVHYFDIPQSLRDHALGKGFPLYMTGVPFPLVPVDHDPFRKKDK